MCVREKRQRQALEAQTTKRDKKREWDKFYCSNKNVNTHKHNNNNNNNKLTSLRRPTGKKSAKQFLSRQPSSV